MPPDLSPRSDPALRAALARGLDAPVQPDTARIATFVATAFGRSTLALIHYGSHAQGSGATPESAHDFFVILEDYERGYGSLVRTIGARYSPHTAARLNRILPPNVVSVAIPDTVPPFTAKCAVLSLDDLARACSARAADLWVLARLFQQVQLAWWRDETARAAVESYVSEARARTFDWGRAFLPRTFGAEEFCRALLRTGYGSEIRPEREERADTLIAAQRDVLLPMYSDLLERLVQRGALVREGADFRDPRPPRALGRLGARLFLGRSKARATLRWAKYVALYDDWLDYVVHKVERRGDVSIEITPRERRWPLIFLWPKALRVLTRRGAPRR